MEEVRIADLCFSSTVVAAFAEDPIDHDDDHYDDDHHDDHDDNGDDHC